MTEHDNDVTTEAESTPNPAALSLVGGFVGTVTGLKRSGVPGAVVGGFVGGTVGYLTGASVGDEEAATALPEGDSEPISVGVPDDSGEEDTEDGAVEDDADDTEDDESEADEETTDDDTEGEDN